MYVDVYSYVHVHAKYCVLVQNIIKMYNEDFVNNNSFVYNEYKCM